MPLLGRQYGGAVRGVRWLLFDVGGVLCHTDDEVWPARLESTWARRLGIDLQAFSQRVAAADLPDVGNNAGLIDLYWAGYGAAVGADDDQVETMRAEFWDAYCGQTDTTLLEYVRGLHGRLGLAILSNSADGAREEEEARFGFSELFHPIFYSHEIGFSKPNPDVFAHALTHMNADPRTVVFVDNIAENVAAAKALGMRGIVHTSAPETIGRLKELIEAL